MRTFTIIMTLALLALAGRPVAADDNSLTAKFDYDHGGLDIQILLVSRKAIMKNPMKAPKAVSSYKRGDNVLPIITFRTEHADQDGNADLTYDMTVFQPDSSVSGEFKQQILIKGRPIAPDRYGFAEGPPEISLDENSPLGVYRVEFVVHENVHQAKIDCTLSFQVIE